MFEIYFAIPKHCFQGNATSQINSHDPIASHALLSATSLPACACTFTGVNVVDFTSQSTFYGAHQELSSNRNFVAILQQQKTARLRLKPQIHHRESRDPGLRGWLYHVIHGHSDDLCRFVCAALCGASGSSFSTTLQGGFSSSTSFCSSSSRSGSSELLASELPSSKCPRGTTTGTLPHKHSSTPSHLHVGGSGGSISST